MTCQPYRDLLWCFCLVCLQFMGLTMKNSNLTYMGIYPPQSLCISGSLFYPFGLGAAQNILCWLVRPSKSRGRVQIIHV